MFFTVDILSTLPNTFLFVILSCPHSQPYHSRDGGTRKIMTLYLPCLGVGPMLRHFIIVLQQLWSRDKNFKTCLLHATIATRSIDVAQYRMLLHIWTCMLNYYDILHHRNIFLSWQKYGVMGNGLGVMHYALMFVSFYDNGFTTPWPSSLFVIPRGVLPEPWFGIITT